MTTSATIQNATIEEYVEKVYQVCDIDWETGTTSNPRPAQSVEEAQSMARHICEEMYGVGNVITLNKDFAGNKDGKMQAAGVTIKVQVA